MMFAKYIYPKIDIGASHARPLMPFCFRSLIDVSVQFNINSSNDVDRVEFWEVDEAEDCSGVGRLYTQSEMEQDLYGMSRAAYIAARSEV